MPDTLFSLLEREMARRGGGEAEVYVRRMHTRKYDARGGGIDSISFSDTVSLGLRVFRDGRMGFSYGFGEGREEIERMAEAAIFCAGSSDRDDAYGLPDSPPDGRGCGDHPGDPALFDPSSGGVEDREKAEFACELESMTLAFDPRMKRVRTASLTEKVAEVRLWNTNGRFCSQRESCYFASVDSVAEDGNEGQTGYGFGFARRFGDLKAGDIAGEAAHRAIRMLGARSLSTGRIPAVLENGAAADLLEVLVPSFLATQVVKGKSMLAGKIGKPVASPAVEVIDDPFDPSGTGATPFDGEGVPSRRNVLVEAGILRSFLADTFWGRKAGTGTTASLRRSAPKVPPAVGISGIRVSQGERTPGELLGELGSGVVLTEFLGIHTADPVSGNFSIGASGIRFEGGEAKEPVRGFAVAGNVISLLKDVVSVGSDFRWFGNAGSPSLSVSHVEIGGS